MSSLKIKPLFKSVLLWHYRISHMKLSYAETLFLTTRLWSCLGCSGRCFRLVSQLGFFRFCFVSCLFFLNDTKKKYLQKVCVILGISISRLVDLGTSFCTGSGRYNAKGPQQCSSRPPEGMGAAWSWQCRATLSRALPFLVPLQVHEHRYLLVFSQCRYIRVESVRHSATCI